MSKPTLFAKLAGCAVLPPMESVPLIATVGETVKAKTSHRKADQSSTGDRFGAINAFADVTLQSLDRAEIAIWLLLWRDTKPNGLARTSQADLARRAGVAERTVKRAVVSLCKRGLLLVVHRGGLLRGASTYRVFPLDKQA